MEPSPPCRGIKNRTRSRDTEGVVLGGNAYVLLANRKSESARNYRGHFPIELCGSGPRQPVGTKKGEREPAVHPYFEHGRGGTAGKRNRRAWSVCGGPDERRLPRI